MRDARRLLRTATALLVTAAAAPPLGAQSDVLLQLRSGSPAGDRFRVDSAGAWVSYGNLGIGTPIHTGSGLRTMWYPWRGAFRSGEAMGNEWDHDNLGFYSFAGGLGSRARGIYGIAWGNQSVADAQASVALGQGNVVHGTSPDFGTAGVALGASNQVFKIGGVAIGWEARSGRTGSPTGGGGEGAVAIGRRVSAIANFSVALGVRAVAEHAGAFVWGSTTTAGALPTDSIRSTATGQFSIRAVGGIRLLTNQAMSSGVTMSAGGSTWNAVSDRDRKENFALVDGEDVLARLRSVPVTSWNYIAEGRQTRHIGPMAQDWHAAFALNDDPLTINQGDFDGVNLAAIQALEARTAALREWNAELGRVTSERIAALEAENATLRQALSELARSVARLEAAASP
jgi:trimeric autotransporter adhesin